MTNRKSAEYMVELASVGCALRGLKAEFLWGEAMTSLTHPIKSTCKKYSLSHSN
jgi:hypothetical protein